MPLTHEFYLIDRAKGSVENYLDWPRDRTGIALEDDLVGYMWDALSWIPCVYPHARERAALGPDRYGPTAILAEGAGTLASIMDGYAKIFASGPVILNLDCGVSLIATDESKHRADKMVRNIVEFNRDQTVAKLREIASIAHRVASDGERCFIAIMGL